jgi:threonine dehydratase
MENTQGLMERLKPTDLLVAYDHIEELHSKSPLIDFGVVHSDGFDISLYAKMDTLNPGGSFKDRGSEFFIYRAIRMGLLKQGDTIVTASAGNHAKGVAKAAKRYGLNAIIYMADSTPEKKIRDTKKLGSDVRLVSGDYHSAAQKGEAFAKEENLLYVPAYEHPDIIAGQSTVVTEAMLQLYELGKRPDFFVFPFGGGGLANGGGFAARRFDDTGEFLREGYGNKVNIFGVQAQNFNTMVRSYRNGKIMSYIERGDTIADGIRVPRASPEMLRLSLNYLDGMFDVTEAQLKDAVRRVYRSEALTDLMSSPEEVLRRAGFNKEHISRIDRLNIIEGAAAAAFACVIDDTKIPFQKIATQISPRREIVGVVAATGNNIDQRLLEEILSGR